MEVELYKMIYKKENINTNDLRILGEVFVKNNRNKGLLITNNKKKTFPLKGLISFDEMKNNKIKMVLKRYIYNKSCLFKDCEALESLSQLAVYPKTKLKNDEINNDNYINEYNNKIVGSDKKESLNITDDNFSNSFFNNSISSISEIYDYNEENIKMKHFIVLMT